MIREHHNSGGHVRLEYCCDFCSFGTVRNRTWTGVTPIMECDACGRHVCSGHRRFHKEPWVDSHKGMYCLECWEIGSQFRESMISIQNAAWEKENDLRLAWHRQGRKNRTFKLLSVRTAPKEAASHYGQ